MQLSRRVTDLQYSAIRKLTGIANQVKADGKKVIHLNVGVPDSPTPPEFYQAIAAAQPRRLAYSPSVGEGVLKEAISDYFKTYGLAYDPQEILITTGASEAIAFCLFAMTDPGDAILTTDPYYSNYKSFLDQWGIQLQTFATDIDHAYALPDRAVIEHQITEKTKAILICNPDNPTGRVYDREELVLLGEIARDHDLFIIADEIYRDFLYTDRPFVSFGELTAFEDRVVLIDSVSKRYSACGARIGAILCHHPGLLSQFTKLCTSRLAVATLDQIGAAALYQKRDTYLDHVLKDYQMKRDVAYDRLSRIPGVSTYPAQGAFYAMVKVPVTDTDAFCTWLLTDFSDQGQTVMLAPAAGFYQQAGRGKDEVRIAFAVDLADLERGIVLLGIALDRYHRL